MGKNYSKKLIKHIVVAAVLFVALTASLPVYAWFSLKGDLAAYAPISSPEALYIGAGHIDMENNVFEDVRYMYFNGLDVTGLGATGFDDDSDCWYVDRVFCVYGKAVSGYKLQLAYTTNNRFTYEIFHADESSVESEGAVRYTTHSDTPETYYYSVSGTSLMGTYLNKQTVNGEDIATGTLHFVTYGEYTSVNKYVEPVYWQTNAVEEGSARENFVNYYILRVKMNGKNENDRETDILCIAAKSFAFTHSH